MLAVVGAATPSRSKRYTPPGSPRVGPRAGRPPADRDGGHARTRAEDEAGVGGGRRVAAATLDAVLVPAAVLGAAELARWSGALRRAGVTRAGWDAWSQSYVLVAWTVAAVAVAYHGLCTAAWHRTPGKALAGLAVVTDDGRAPSLPVSLWRAAWSAVIYAPVVLAPVVVVAGWLSLWGPRHRSLADRAARTRVVRAPGTGP